MAVMEVGITEFRSNMSHWLTEIKAGDEILLTERDIPIARIIGVNGLTSWEQMIREGIVTPSTQQKRTKAENIKQISATGSVSNIVSEHRDHPIYS